MRYIVLEKDKLIIKFDYNEQLVNVIRTIDGRQFNKTRKCWEVPKENVVEVLDRLTPFNFSPDKKVLDLRVKQTKFFEEISELKAGTDAEYDGVLPLFDFQRKGVKFLKSMPHALLADVPGLGKSIQSIAATENVEQTLVFCPSSLKYSWKAELDKWGEGCLVIDGDAGERREQWIMAKGMVSGGVVRMPKYVIANYELLIRDFEAMNVKEWGAIICDEATRISNPEAKTTVALKKLRAGKRIAMTGTPISNSPDDIFSIIDWIVPGYLGNFFQFRDKYCVTDEKFGRIIGYKNVKELSEKVNRFILRRTKEEVFDDFPAKMLEDVIFSMNNEELNAYKAIKESILEELNKIVNSNDREWVNHQIKAVIPVRMLRLKQCADHIRLLGIEGESSKLKALREKLKPIIESGEKAIIFTQFAEMLKILQEELAEYLPEVIFGAVSPEDRMKAVDRFNKKEGPGVIIMTEAGGMGLNIQSASYVFHYDAPWSIAKLTQREDRAHRYGQKKTVTVYNMVAKNTIDEYVAKVLHKKNKISVEILQDVERMSEVLINDESNMDVDTIREILRL